MNYASYEKSTGSPLRGLFFIVIAIIIIILVIFMPLGVKILGLITKVKNR